MYSGVGIGTARGSGTSGYVQRNLGAMRPVRADTRFLKENYEKPLATREIDPGIVHHNALREIEVQLVQLQDQLEDEKLSDNEIERRITVRREELRQSIDPTALISVPRNQGVADSHALAMESRVRDERVALAFGLGEKQESLPERETAVPVRNRSRSRSRGSRSGGSEPRDRHGRRYRHR